MGVVMLVRHGQASFGSEDYDVLSSRGVRQSRKVAQTLAGYGISPTMLVHGGMRRQRETAEQMLNVTPWEIEVQVDERWRELDHLASRNFSVAHERCQPVSGQAGKVIPHGVFRWCVLRRAGTRHRAPRRALLLHDFLFRAATLPPPGR